jgi:hypothetical protein
MNLHQTFSDRNFGFFKEDEKIARYFASEKTVLPSIQTSDRSLRNATQFLANSQVSSSIPSHGFVWDGLNVKRMK